MFHCYLAIFNRCQSQVFVSRRVIKNVKPINTHVLMKIFIQSRGCKVKKLTYVVAITTCYTFLSKVPTKYIFPTALKHNLRFFLKSKNAQSLTISPNVHSTEVLTSDIDLLNCSCSGVRFPPLNPVCLCTLKGMQCRHKCTKVCHQVPTCASPGLGTSLTF